MEDKELEEFRELEGKLENPNDRYIPAWPFSYFHSINYSLVYFWRH